MKNTCPMDMKDMILPGSRGLAQFRSEGACGDDAYFFIQAPCKLPVNKMEQRQVQGLMIGCIAVFIYLYTLVYIDYIRSVQVTKYIDWDVKTITAGDYTIEFDIDKSVYYRFLEQFHDKSNPISEIAQFRLFLKDELEHRITEMPSLGLDGPEDEGQPIRIAIITFAFDNYKVINWLRERGTYIKNEDWPRLERVNNDIK